MVGKDDMMQQAAQRAQRVGFRQLRQAAAAAQSAEMDAAVDMPIGEIAVSESIQVRVAGLDANKVAEYAVVMEEAGGYGDFPPIDLFRDGDGKLWVGDGHHRLEAAIRAGLDVVRAVIRPGGFEAAVEFAEDANLRHGLALTTRDKRYIYERRWKRGHEWRHFSDGAIARALGVTRQTISNWRRQLEETEGATGKNLPVGPRMGADGKVRDVSGIQEANRRRAAESQRYLAQAGMKLLDLLDAVGGRMEFNALVNTTEGVDAQTAERALRYLAQAGEVVFVGVGEEIWASLPEVGDEHDEKPPSGAQRVRYVEGDFNQDVGEEAVFGVPVAEVEEEDLFALARRYEAHVLDLLAGSGPLTYVEIRGQLGVPQGDMRHVRALRRALDTLFGEQRIRKDGGRYSLAGVQTAADVPIPPSDEHGEDVHPAEMIPGFDTLREALPPDPVGEKALLHNLRVLADVSAALARELESVRAGHIVITRKQEVRTLAEDVLDFFQGYESVDGKPVAGIGALLIELLGKLDEEGGR